MPKVLLTGGSGFIASHILDLLLDQGYEVVTTVRSTLKGEMILDYKQGSVNGSAAQRLKYVVVDNIGSDDAMDTALQLHAEFDFVIHTASPYTQNFVDPVKDILDPAIKGTVGLLRSIQTFAPSVKRVVILSSFAAINNPLDKIQYFDESSWNPVTWEHAISNPSYTYAASKTLAEQAAWDFVKTEKVQFDLVTLNPPLVFGPVNGLLSSLDNVNTSNQRILDIAQGKHKDGLLPATIVYIWVDVRDLALAHIKCIEIPSAGNQRLLITAGYFSNMTIVEAIAQTHPEIAHVLPSNPKDDTPDNVYRYDNTKGMQILGLRYRSFKETIGDTVTSLMHRGLSVATAQGTELI